MASELVTTLGKRRSNVDAFAEVWESLPEVSSADACHLEKLNFDAPSARAWLRGLEPTPEEDTLADIIAEALHERGLHPAHAPTLDPQLRSLVDALAKAQQSIAAERLQLSETRVELSQLKAEVRSREEALEQEWKRRVDMGTAGDYPPPSWLADAEGKINIGVVGNAGVGKSLLINRLRRIRPGADGWAPVGINETTQQPTQYAFPKEPRVRLWDLPGAGTPNFPACNYIQTMGLRYFDKVLIVTAGRFTTTEVGLMTELKQYEIPYFLVRTKVDIDVWNNNEDNGFDERQTLMLIVDDFRLNHKVENPYLVSSRQPALYDMYRLTQDIFPVQSRQLDASAPSFCPGVPAWSEPWAMPVAYSPTLAALQGLWSDHYGNSYLIQGSQVHVTRSDGFSAVVDLVDSAQGVFWSGRWWVNSGSISRSRCSTKVLWTPVTLTDKPFVLCWVN